MLEMLDIQIPGLPGSRCTQHVGNPYPGPALWGCLSRLAWAFGDWNGPDPQPQMCVTGKGWTEVSEAWVSERNSFPEGEKRSLVFSPRPNEGIGLPMVRRATAPVSPTKCRAPCERRGKGVVSKFARSEQDNENIELW